MAKVLDRFESSVVNSVRLTEWVARGLGLMLAALVLMLAIGNGIDLRLLTTSTGFMFAAFFTAVIGMLVLWRSRLAGGLMVVGGMAAFYLCELVVSGQLPGGWVFPLCFVPGLLALASWAIAQQEQRRQGASRRDQ